MLKVVAQLKSRKSQTPATLFRGPATIGLELKTLATRFISSIASGVVLAVLPVSADAAEADFHIFTTDTRVTKEEVSQFLANGGAVSNFSSQSNGDGTFTVSAIFDWSRYENARGDKSEDGCKQGPRQEDPFVSGLITVEQFGQNQIATGKSAFWCLRNMTGGPGFKTLDTSNLTTFQEMFRNANKFNEDISLWNTSDVKSFRYAFDDARLFNSNIGNWKTNEATDMYQMFTGASNFDQDISTKGNGKWDVSGVTNMGNMFQNASSFNQPIGNWEVSAVIPSTQCNPENPGKYNCNFGMSGMFARATSFNQDLSGWDVSAFVPDAPLPNSQRLAFDQGLDSTWTGKNPATGNYWCNKGRPHFDGEECGAPDAPTNLAATAGNTEVHITFDEPDDNGAVISDYEYSLNNGTEVSAGDTSPSLTISNLTNGTSYSIRVRAVNAAGEGDWSVAVSATPESGAAPPDAPTNVTVVSTATGAVTLSFTAGNNNGSEITGYQASWEEVSGPSVEDDDPLSSDGFVPASGTASPVTVGGLTDGRAYDITLRAVNGEGPGGDSNPPVRVLLPATSNLYPPSTDVPSVNLKLTSAASCSVDTSDSANKPHSPTTPLPDTIASVEDVEVEFDLLCSTPGETVGITLELPDTDITETAVLYKIRENGVWDEIEEAMFDYANDSVQYSITDLQSAPPLGYDGYDLDAEPGKMRDPVVVAYKIDTDGDGVPDTEDACPTDPTCSARPVPTLTWPVLLTLFGLLGWLGYRRLKLA